ncbi:gp16 family protein [Paludibacterium denitrificans]|uniref:DUF1018 domain-containing protein n=1 Tax=Paludibacterium denitrificans TaxID=2675226 RepID=A0A844GA87_9NEIS|nr:regulatory protein GemA [Paludibacterium denitrificans]MTD32539.1 DUF1018 domain-containing protein [Paludibacterium denitrificans]
MTDRRKAMISKIHIAKQQLQMADDSYRAMLARLAEGKTSSTKLTLQQLDDVLAEMKRLGFVQKTVRNIGKRPNPQDDRKRYMAKVEALLADQKRPWDYADGMALRMFKVEKVAWLDDDQLRRLMIGLEIDARRHGKGTEAWEK